MSSTRWLRARHDVSTFETMNTTDGCAATRFNQEDILAIDMKQP